MDDRTRKAVCRIDVGQSRGTGTLVAPDLVLTALHVVADRHADPPVPYEGTIALTFPDFAGEADIVEGARDAAADWVLLRLRQEAPEEVRPVPLGRLKGSPVPWTTFGFPDANPRDGMAQKGTVRMSDGRLEGQWALQLFSEEAAAGRGAPVRGLSGAPVIVDGRLVGVLRFALMKEGETVAGTLYACPAALPARAREELPRPETVEPWSRRLDRLARWVAAALVVGGAGFGAWWEWVRPEPAKVLAIKPFHDDTLGIATGLYRHLSRIDPAHLRPEIPSDHAPDDARFVLAGAVDRRTGTLLTEIQFGGQPSPLPEFDLAATNPWTVEDSLALAVLQALGVPAEEAARATARPSEGSREVYGLIRRGQRLMDGVGGSDGDGIPRDTLARARSQSATSLFRQVVERQPDLVEGWSSLSNAYSILYFWSDTLPEVRDVWADSAHIALERAQALDSTGVGVLQARGVYRYRVERDYAGAVLDLTRALQDRPGDSGLNFVMGLVQRRVRRWSEAVRYLQAASDGDRGAWDKAFVAAETFVLLNRFQEADRYFQRAQSALATAASPDTARMVRTLVVRGIAHVLRTAETDSLRAAVDRALAFGDTAVVLRSLIQPEHRFALRLLDPSLQERFLEMPEDAAGGDPIFYHLTLADAHHHQGETEGARAHADRALSYLDDWGDSHGDSTIAGYHMDRALALAFLGRSVEAVSQAAGALERVRKEMYVGSGSMARAVNWWWATEVHLLVGDTVRAGQLAREQLATPGHLLTGDWIRADRAYAPLRSTVGRVGDRR